MKAIKVAGKIVGWIIGCYAILNTLAWAAIGAGYGLGSLRDAFDDDRIQDNVGYTLNRVVEEASSGWKWWLSICKDVFEVIVEDIKDAF